MVRTLIGLGVALLAFPASAATLDGMTLDVARANPDLATVTSTRVIVGPGLEATDPDIGAIDIFGSTITLSSDAWNVSFGAAEFNGLVFSGLGPIKSAKLSSDVLISTMPELIFGGGTLMLNLAGTMFQSPSPSYSVEEYLRIRLETGDIPHMPVPASLPFVLTAAGLLAYLKRRTRRPSN